MRLSVVKAIFLAAYLVGLLLLLIAAGTEEAIYAYVGLGIEGAALIFRLVMYRCPYCGVPLGKGSFRYCPHCGRNLED